MIIEPTFCGSRFSTGRLLAIDDFTFFTLCTALAFDGIRSIVNHYRWHYHYIHSFPFIQLWLFLETPGIRSDIFLGFQAYWNNSYTIHNQWWYEAYHRKPSSNITGYERYMAGKSIKTVALFWNPRHVQLTPLQFNWLHNRWHSIMITNDDLRQIIETIYKYHWLWIIVYGCQTNSNIIGHPNIIGSN